MKLDAEVRTELEAIARRCDCELLEADYRGGVFKLVLDREAGVTVDECSTVSREVSAFLDVVDFGSANYTLEVSSPGLDREFYRESDYERFAGSRVRVSWLEEGKKRTDVGQLLGFEATGDGGPRIEVELADGVRTIGLAEVVKTRLEPEF